MLIELQTYFFADKVGKEVFFFGFSIFQLFCSSYAKAEDDGKIATICLGQTTNLLCSDPSYERCWNWCDYALLDAAQAAVAEQWRSFATGLQCCQLWKDWGFCKNSSIITIFKYMTCVIKMFLRLDDIIGNTVSLVASARWRHSLMAEEACRPHHQDMREGPWHWSLLLLLVKKKDLLVMLAEEIRGIASSPSWCLAWCSIVKKHLSEIIFDRKFWGEQKIVLVEMLF